MPFNRIIHSIVAVSFVLGIGSAARAIDADGWYPAPVTQTVFYPQTETVYYSQPTVTSGASSTPVYTECHYWVAKPVTETSQAKRK